jgi:hypothetical protein
MAAFMNDWCAKASQTGIGQLIKMAKTLLTHASGILAYARYPITTGRLEGINNKIGSSPKRVGDFEVFLSIWKSLLWCLPSTSFRRMQS